MPPRMRLEPHLERWRVVPASPDTVRARYAVQTLRTERLFQWHVRTLLAMYGWMGQVHWSERNSPPGWPDVFAVHRLWGRVLVAELKVGRRRPTRQQCVWLDALHTCGTPRIEVYVWYPAQIEQIELVLSSPRSPRSPRIEPEKESGNDGGCRRHLPS